MYRLYQQATAVNVIQSKARQRLARKQAALRRYERQQAELNALALAEAQAAARRALER